MTDPYAIAERRAIQEYERQEEAAWKAANPTARVRDTAGASDAAPPSEPNPTAPAGSS